MKKLLCDDRLDISYYRLSLADDDEKDESNSISSQRKIAREFCNRELPEAELYELIDDGYTGTNFNRPAMRRLLKLVRDGRVRTILVKDLSRFGRNYLDVGYYLEYFFPLYNVRFVSIDDNFDTAKIDSSMQTMEMAIRNLLNDRYSKDISQKIKSSVHLKKMAGEYCFGAVPFGYKKGEVKNTIVIDDDAAKIVRYIFNLALEGKRIAEIAKVLNAENVITPSKYLAPIRKNYKVVEQWSYESVRNILTNRIYTGDTEPYKSHVKKVGSKDINMIPEAEREVILNTHEGIITYEEFVAAREVVAKTKPKTKSNASNSVLTGKLICGCCGNRLLKGKASNKFFLCANRRYRGTGGCMDVRVNEAEMIQVLQNAIQTHIAVLAEQDRQKEYMLRECKDELKELEKEAERLDRKKKALMDEKMKLYESFVAGELEKEEYLAKKEVVASREKKVAESVLELDERRKQLEAKSSMAPEMNEEKVKKSETAFEMTAEFIDSMIDKVNVNADNDIEICWKFKNEFTEQAGNVTEYRDRKNMEKAV